MRSIIEGTAAERAATRLSPDPTIRLWLGEQSPEPYNLTFDSACHDFHREIARAADSPRLLEAVEQIFHDVQRIQVIATDPPSPKTIHHQHAAIRDAIAAHDAPAARAAMESHIQSLYRQAIESLLGEPLVSLLRLAAQPIS